MNIRPLTEGFDSKNWDAIFFPIFEDEQLDSEPFQEMDAKTDGLLVELFKNDEFTGEEGQVEVIHRPRGIPCNRLVLAGAGKRSDSQVGSIRRHTESAIRSARSKQTKQILLWVREEGEGSIQATAEGALLSSYSAREYKSNNKANRVREIYLYAPKTAVTGIEETISKGVSIAEATILARRLAHEPGNLLPPQALAQQAVSSGHTYGFEVEVLDEDRMSAMGMNAILAVAQGSVNPARLIVLRHRPASSSSSGPLVLIGKGVTFDSGGISIKPSQSMEEMKGDKAGACAVLGALCAISKLNASREVVGIIPAVENLPGGRAQRPGDVIRSYSGKTIEVINTDAEGRLILADALTYAQELSPACIVDIATLTGACVVALGHVRAGVFCNDEALFERVQSASQLSGERLWRLPLDSEYRKLMDSTIADIKNSGPRWAGAITAAKFLEEFSGQVPWCHIDMAGVDLFRDNSHTSGPTGFGVATFAELALAPDTP